MEIKEIRTIRGPNVFHHKPVLIMTLALQDLTEVASTDLPGFSERLVAHLPGLKAHGCSLPKAGGFVERLRTGTYFAHIVEHIALEFSTMAGIEVNYGKSVFAGEIGLYNVAVRYQNEEGMKFLLQTAVEFAQALVKEEVDYPMAKKIAEAKRIIAETQLGPSTQAIVDAADRRGIPWMRLNDLNLIQFGYGKHRQLIQATTTGRTSDIAVDIAQDKNLTKRMLSAANIRVPCGMLANDEGEALRVFAELGGGPVVLKPVDGHHGHGVCLNLKSASEVAAAYQIAAKHSSQVIVEEYLNGKDFRILVVGGKMVAAAERVPAHVVADGMHTIEELVDIENRNPLRGEGHEKPMTKIFMDETALNYLSRAGMKLSDVPKFGETVFLNETAKRSTGGTAVDVTDLVHPEVRLLSERAARLIGLDICGVDIIAQDIAEPVGCGLGVIELNAGPGIRMHTHPSRGKSRDVGGAIMNMMYPENGNGRIPVISITGTNGKTTVARLISFALRTAGWKVGMTTTDGIYIGGIKVASGDTTGPISARAVLADPKVEIAVLETARGGIVKRGLGFDWCDVGVITNIHGDHIGQDGIETIDDILHIKSLVSERVRDGGSVVLNADDENLVKLAAKLETNGWPRQLIYFSLDAANPVIRKHLKRGGLAYCIESEWIVEARYSGSRRLIHTSEIPLTLFGTAQFQVANVLAALSACVAQGMSYANSLLALRRFRSNEHNLGRANLYKMGRGYVMLDYGHNPDAFKAVCAMTAQWHKRRLTAVIGVPGDRSNGVIIEAAKAAGRGFHRIFLRDDLDLRGRLPGEAPQIFRTVVKRESPNVDCTIILDEREAMHRALSEIEDGEIVVMFYDEMQPAIGMLEELGAVPFDTFERAPFETLRKVARA